MNRIDKKFRELKDAGRKALIVFVTAGDPDLRTTEKLVPELFKSGADIVELGIPFSDPLADGPVIQRSFKRALDRGVSLKKIFDAAKRIRRNADGPLVFMSAFNLCLQYGVGRFTSDAVRAGIDGVIFPDLIPEEAGDLPAKLAGAGIAPIFLVAPTSGQERIEMITGSCGGFVYYISVTGVTGKQKPLAQEVRTNVAAIKKTTALPVAAGFGISTPEQAAAIGKLVDGIIVGSAAVRLVESASSPANARNRIIAFVRRLRKALDGKR